MKFLNEIDGANRVKQDSQNRFVTDAEKVVWNGKQSALGYAPVNKAGDTMTGNLSMNADKGVVFGGKVVMQYNENTKSLDFNFIT